MFDEKCRAAYASISSRYIAAKTDGMIPPAAEATMAAGIGADVTEIDGSHAAMLSHPQAMADVILATAAAVN